MLIARRSLVAAWAVGAIVVIAGAAACTGGDGGVDVVFLLPAEEQTNLSPLVGLAEITLETSSDGQPTRSETRRFLEDDDRLDMGSIDVGTGISLAVRLRSATQRLIGYGRSPTTFDVTPEDSVEVPVRVRRPFVYVTGPASGIATFDSTLESSVTAYQSSIGTEGMATVAVGSSDGAEIWVATSNGDSNALIAISTADHQRAAVEPVPLRAPAVDAAVSADSRWLVLAHSGEAGGVSIVDLQRAREGQGQATFVALGNVGRVAIGPAAGAGESAFALLDAAPEPGCEAPASSIVELALADGAMLMTEPLDQPARDFAAATHERVLVIADGCENRLLRLRPGDDVGRSVLTMLPAASAVAIWERRVWAIGTIAAAGDRAAKPILVSIALDGKGERRVELPAVEEQAVSREIVGEGQQAGQRMGADGLDVYDLAVVPGAEHIAVLARAYFHGNEFFDPLLGVVIPEMEMLTHEYLLIDTANASIAHRLRTRCQLVWSQNPFPVLDRWGCGQSPEQDVPAAEVDEFVPVHVSVLYGSR